MLAKIDFQYLTDKDGNKTAVIIPINDWANICENITEFDTYDSFKTKMEAAFEEVEEMKKGNRPKVSLGEFIKELE